MNTKKDVYQIVTDRILAEMGKGIIPWQKPWITAGSCINYVSRRPYSLLNMLLLGEPGEYLTYNQVKSLGGYVKRGAKSRIVFFYKVQQKEVTKADGTVELEKYSIPRYYEVFHISDTAGIESKLESSSVVLSPVEEAEKLLRAYEEREPKLTVQRDKASDSAYYSVSKDSIVVPALSQFEEIAEYYSTTFHEYTHSTGIEGRCARGIENDSTFGSDSYSKEELVAEFGAAMLLCKVGIDTSKAIKNSASYIDSWASKFRQDRRLIISAASKAEQAVSYILGEK